jgi:Carboxypeptidase regulatory-like domain/TonB dependent receptor
MRRVLLAAVLFTLLGFRDAYAQTGQGRLNGVVIDADHAVLPGVTVVATSPSLIGQQTATTQSDGRYLFPALPPGTYSLTFTLPDFETLLRANIALPLATTITVDAQLELARLQERVVVTAASPVVDVATTKVGVNLKGDSLIGVPNSTDIWGALAESPGIRIQGFDVGGSHKSQQSSYEVFGIQGQTRVVSDGIDHTEGVGGTGFYEDYYANEEVSVSALGSDVEMNGGGAAIVTTIKSGGNTFKGLYHLGYEPGRWVADNRSPALTAQGFTGNPNLLFWEGHADLGGPVKKDRLWFFYAFNHFTIDKVVSGVPRELGTDIGLFDNHTAKSTWKLSPTDTVIGYFQQGRKQKPRRGIGLLVPPESTANQDSYSRMYKGEWQRVLSDRAFLDVTVGRFTLHAFFTTDTNAQTNPPTFALDTGENAGAPFFPGTYDRSKPQVKAQLTEYVPARGGSHDFKFGFEYIYDWYRQGTTGVSGPIQYRTINGQPVRVRFLDVGAPSDFDTTWSTSPNVDQHYTLYGQDRWTPSDRVSITAGARVDYQDVGYLSSIRKPVITDGVFPATSTVAGMPLVQTTNVAARLGITYDLTGHRDTVLKAFYGRYYNNLADSFSAANPGGGKLAEYNFHDLNGNGRYDGPQELGSLRFTIGGASASVNPALRTPFVEEFSGSLERQFWGESSLRVTLVRKNSRDYVPYYYSGYIPAWLGQLKVATAVNVVGPSGQPETYNVFDIPESLNGQSEALFDNIPDSDFHYTTLELAFRSHLGTRFLAQISGDHQWRNELRTADIPDWGNNDPLSTDPIGVNFFLNPNPAVPNRQRTTTYHLQALGRYLFARDIGAAVNFRYQSGFPYSRIIPDGALPNLSPAPFFVENLDRHRSDNVALLNLRFDKTFSIRMAKLTLMLDIDNVLNANPVTNFNLLNDDFGHVIAVLDPRVAQVGLRVVF